MISYIVKENHIGSAINEIIWYKQAKKIVLLYKNGYRDIIIKRFWKANVYNITLGALKGRRQGIFSLGRVEVTSPKTVRYKPSQDLWVATVKRRTILVQWLARSRYRQTDKRISCYFSKRIICISNALAKSNFHYITLGALEERGEWYFFVLGG